MSFNSTTMNARASPGGDAVHTRPSGVTNVRWLPRQDRWSRLKKQVGRLRVVSWNVGTMTGKAMEIADVLRRRKVDIACVQQVKWKGSKARDVGMATNFFYHGDTSNRNGVGIILGEERTQDILEISRISDRIILHAQIHKR